MNFEKLLPIILLSGFLLGSIFGAVAYRCNFCTMGAISDIINMGSWQRMRSWCLAIAIAILGTQLLSILDIVDNSKNIYTTANLPWLGNIIGGFLFGIGMTFASGCGNKTILRFASGNLKSLIVLVVMAIVAMMTVRGILAPLRVNILQANLVVLKLDFPQTFPHIFSQFGLTLKLAQYICTFLFVSLLFTFVFWRKSIFQDKENLVAGLILGILIVLAWLITGYFGMAENPDNLEIESIATNSKMAESFTFIGPLVNSLDTVSRWLEKSQPISWGICVFVGVIFGAFFMAIYSKSFQWESFKNTEDLTFHLIGAVLMGFGGVTAGGCTIGQGLTGVSTLAIGSFISLFALIAGCVVALKYQYWRLDRLS